MAHIDSKDRYADARAYDTPEKARRVIERLAAALDAQKREVMRLRRMGEELDAELSETRHRLREEADGRKSSERENRLIVSHYQRNAEEELEKRTKELMTPSQERILELKREKAALESRVSKLSTTIDKLQDDLRGWHKELEDRVLDKREELERRVREVEAETAKLRHERELWEKTRREREMDLEEDHRKRSVEMEEEFHSKSVELATEHERLKREIEVQKRLLDSASHTWDSGIEEMRRHLEEQEAEQRREHEKRLEDLKRTKESFQKEALWLQRRHSERQEIWEEKLRTKDDRIEALEEKISQFDSELATKEKQFRETLGTMAEELEKARKAAFEKAKAEAAKKAAKIPMPKPAPGAKPKPKAGLEDVLGPDGRVGGITPQDLVFGIAHQIRNPLAIIRTHAEFCLRKFKITEKEQEPLQAIIRGTHNLGRRLDDLVDLTRPRSLHLQEISLKTLLEQLCVLMATRAEKQNVEIESELPESLPVVKIDPEQVKEAMLHLVVNAIEAMPKGGKLKISAYLLPTKNIACVEFKDNGMGIVQEHMEEIYKPFFSTKPGGVGLGLTLAMQIFGLHGGAIIVDSEPGKGTNLKCYLPVKGPDNPA